MKKKILDILIVERDDIDFLALKRHLNWSNTADFRLTRTLSADAAVAAARDTAFDCALVDYTTISGAGPTLPPQFTALGSAVPVVVLTGHQVGKFEDLSLKDAVFDSLEKTALTQQLLQRTIFYAMENHKIMRTLRLALEDAQTRARMKRHVLSLVREQIEPALTAISQHPGDADKVKAMAEQGLTFLKVLAGYTRLHDDDLRLSLESFSGASLFSSMIDGLTALARQQGVTVTVSHAGLDDIHLQGDREKLGQLVEAIAGRLVSSPAVGKVSLEATQADGRLVFDMAVSAKPDEQRPVLADILSVTHPQAAENGGDLSLLSLASAYRLIALLKGAMTLPSQGTCRLTIPVTVTAPSEGTPARMLFPARDQYYSSPVKA